MLTPEGPRPIEELRAGDLVLSRDEHDDGTASPTPQRIEEHFVREGELWELTLRGEVLTATPEHPFFVKPRPDAKNGGWTPAGQLEPGDLLSTDAGEWLPLEKLENTGRRQTVYNMRVAEFATYFVAPASCSFGVWVHNTYRGIAPATVATRGNIIDSLGSTVQKRLADIRKIDPNAQIGFRGSLASGVKRAKNGNPAGPFDPSDFDVDIFVVSDKLRRGRGFQVGPKPLRDIAKQLDGELRQLPEFGGLRGGKDKLQFRIFGSEEIGRKAARGDSQIFFIGGQ